jgi:hypothetical protein
MKYFKGESPIHFLGLGLILSNAVDPTEDGSPDTVFLSVILGFYS